ncbi:NnrS family protein [Agarivorans sp. 1_MG-2023]|uniref:NnrS family protein n=1 Tax=Agarivorans sp. 1_MG-2023 TaxID=3062634 RepID=UPI0026E19F96|nr:NnrS family protein [Agarivorans sp. 1_MG-2023]MDO6765410.1 NnrS family protein [Agarivorans sp. 1_MG-2023]
MIKIGEPNATDQAQHWHQQAILELAFRPFFLLATLSSAISIGLWILLLNGNMLIGSQGLSPHVWHAHEMLIGFGTTVAVGFILTAVQTWTGQPSIKGKALAGLVLLWCLARIGFYINDANSAIAATALQGIWWLSVVVIYSKLVFKAQNRRNYIFIALLSVMTLINLGMLVADLNGNSALALHLSRTMVLLFTIMMALVGGRVIPFFTVRGAKTEAIECPAWVNQLVGPFAIATVLVFISDYFTATFGIVPIALMVLGLLHLLRLAYWRSIKTVKVPLLWSLHLSYLLMALGLILLGASYYLPQLTFSNALHLITIGAIGLMIFAMMSRVSLGHTGRTLVIKPVITLAFLLLMAATLFRTFMAITDPLQAWNISAGLWISANVLFLVVYVPILSSKRQS